MLSHTVGIQHGDINVAEVVWHAEKKRITDLFNSACCIILVDTQLSGYSTNCRRCKSELRMTIFKNSRKKEGKKHGHLDVSLLLATS